MSYYQLNSALTLSGDPVNPMHAATKAYVDAKTGAVDGARFQTGVLAVQKLPGLVGDVSSVQGSNVLSLVDSGVSPGVKYRVDVDSKGRVIAGDSVHSSVGRAVSWSFVTGKPLTLAGYGITDVVSTAGGTVLGRISSDVAPTASMHAVNKALVDTMVSEYNLATVAVGDIVRLPSSVPPAGYLRANGALVNKTTYAGLYAIIGDSFADSGVGGYMGQPWRQQAAFNTTDNGVSQSWTTATSLPGTVYLSQAIVTSSRVYLLGGYINSATSSTVYTAPILADGTLGTWTTAASLPVTVGYSQAIVTSSRVYLLGGLINGATSSTVYTAPILSDGTLGTWTTATSLPGTVHTSQAIVTSSRVYLLGGVINSATSSTVYTAPILADGTLGPWTTAASLPGTVHASQAIVTSSRVYLLGGIVNGVYSSTVYTAPILADGTLGTWTTATSLPGTATHSQAIVTSSRVYLLGGIVNGVYSSTVYTAPILADGTLGTWTTAASLPGTVRDSQAIVTSSRVYLLGGVINGDTSSTVYTTPFSGGTNDYQALITNSLNPTVSPDFRLPDMSAHANGTLQYFIRALP